MISWRKSTCRAGELAETGVPDGVCLALSPHLFRHTNERLRFSSGVATMSFGFALVLCPWSFVLVQATAHHRRYSCRVRAIRGGIAPSSSVDLVVRGAAAGGGGARTPWPRAVQEFRAATQGWPARADHRRRPQAGSREAGSAPQAGRAPQRRAVEEVPRPDAGGEACRCRRGGRR